MVIKTIFKEAMVDIIDRTLREDGVELPDKEILDSVLSVNKKTGLITVENLLIDCDTEQVITAQFRGLRGSDDEFFQKILDMPFGQGHWKLLAKTCVKWGDADNVTSGEFLTPQMPMGTLSWLRANLIVGHYFRIPGNS
jgi:hypothetical protein